MNGIESAQHDLSDAEASVDTAIELLDSIRGENTTLEPSELSAAIKKLQTVKIELEEEIARLTRLQQQI